MRESNYSYAKRRPSFAACDAAPTWEAVNGVIIPPTLDGGRLNASSLRRLFIGLLGA